MYHSKAAFAIVEALGSLRISDAEANLFFFGFSKLLLEDIKPSEEQLVLLFRELLTVFEDPELK